MAGGGAADTMGGGTLVSIMGRAGGGAAGTARGGDRDTRGSDPDLLRPRPGLLAGEGERGGVEVGVCGDRGPGPSISYRGESAVGVPGLGGVLEAGVAGVARPGGEPRISGAVGGCWEAGAGARLKLRLGGSTLVPGAAR